ncbi:MAG: hypothetical protein ACP5MT_01670 [Candidatus Acidifodinimicrobium sp.]
MDDDDIDNDDVISAALNVPRIKKYRQDSNNIYVKSLVNERKNKINFYDTIDSLNKKNELFDFYLEDILSDNNMKVLFKSNLIPEGVVPPLTRCDVCESSDLVSTLLELQKGEEEMPNSGHLKLLEDDIELFLFIVKYGQNKRGSTYLLWQDDQYYGFQKVSDWKENTYKDWIKIKGKLKKKNIDNKKLLDKFQGLDRYSDKDKSEDMYR